MGALRGENNDKIMGFFFFLYSFPSAFSFRKKKRMDASI